MTNGYIGGQSWPITNQGGGYPDGDYVTGALCRLDPNTHLAGVYAGLKYWVHGGKIVNAWLVNSGGAAQQACSFPVKFSGRANITNVSGNSGRLVVTALTSPGTFAPGAKLTIGAQKLTVAGSSTDTLKTTVAGPCARGGLNVGGGHRCRGDTGATIVDGIPIEKHGGAHLLHRDLRRSVSSCHRRGVHRRSNDRFRRRARRRAH